MGWDFCDLLWRLRTHVFFSDRDISLQANRGLFLGSGTQVTDSSLCPVGLIAMWSGLEANIPSGWALCNGSNGTPDLRGSFIVGSGGSYNTGDTGGADTVDLAHTHSISGSTASDSHSHGPGTLATDSDSHSHGPGTLATDSDSHSHTWSDTSDGPSSLVAVASNVHTHDVTTGATDLASGHNHGPGTLATGNPSATLNVANDNHLHDVSGTTSSDQHSHDVDSGSTASDAHSHNVDAGTTASDSHSHGAGTLATDSQLSAAVENRPTFYSLAFIMRIS